MNISQEPFISVFVPTYQRCASVECLLLALIHQTMPAENYEVIVVIDVSTDGTHEMVEQSQSPFKLMTIWQPNQGRATACNLGIREAEGSLVVILDDDMEPSAQLMDAHWDAHQAGIRIGVLGAVPIRLEPTLPPVLQCIGEKFNEHLKKLAEPDYTLKLRDFFSGNFSIRRSLLTEVGLFDDQFNIYGNDDLELSWRLRQAGIQLVYCAEASATQHFEKDYTTLARYNIDKGKTSILFSKLHPEAIHEIKLSTYSQESLKWRLLRACLLSLSQVCKSLPRVIIRSVSWLEKRRSAHLPLYYRFSLDYFYWHE